MLTTRKLSTYLVLVTLALSGCQPRQTPDLVINDSDQGIATATVEPVYAPTSSRPNYAPGELVDYIAQNGDTLPALAGHFNTTESEIRENNPIIPLDVTTLPTGLPLKIPIYYEPLWGTQYQMVSDAAFVHGPVDIGFTAADFVKTHDGWLHNYASYSGTDKYIGGEIVDFVAKNFSISSKLLLALLEYQSGALSRALTDQAENDYPLKHQDWRYEGLYLQLTWTANTLNNGYYSWKSGKLDSFERLNGKIERPDPWQNAATVALQYYFSLVLDEADYFKAISENGFATLYQSLYGDSWNIEPHIPGSLQQPELHFPFWAGNPWAFTGGPHTGWGTGEPSAAIDFAPPSVVGGCTPSSEFVTAVADGVIARSEYAQVVLDLDMDGDERTGWVVFYLHLGNDNKVPQGSVVKTGDIIGHPSCEGGRSTGTHVHIARKFNGEWINASGPLAFNLEGWIANSFDEPYKGSLTKYGKTVVACVCSDINSQVYSTFPKVEN